MERMTNPKGLVRRPKRFGSPPERLVHDSVYEETHPNHLVTTRVEGDGWRGTPNVPKNNCQPAAGSMGPDAGGWK